MSGSFNEEFELEIENRMPPLPDGQDARVEGEGPAGESPKAIIANHNTMIIGVQKTIGRFHSFHGTSFHATCLSPSPKPAENPSSTLSLDL